VTDVRALDLADEATVSAVAALQREARAGRGFTLIGEREVVPGLWIAELACPRRPDVSPG
jgi:hypothetical protein